MMIEAEWGPKCRTRRSLPSPLTLQEILPEKTCIDTWDIRCVGFQRLTKKVKQERR